MTNKENLDQSGYTLENLKLISKLANQAYGNLGKDLDSEEKLSGIACTYLSDAFSEARSVAVTTEKLIEELENPK
tara:strand:- start:32 stop:256 length:225 start_codon:yes stop_codon:yes gene_type:complete